MIDKLRSEPAVVIGLIAGAVLAAIQYLGGHAVISGNVVDSITRALDPTSGRNYPLAVEPGYRRSQRGRLAGGQP